MADETIQVNRAPVLTLWAAVVAERMGYDREAALTLGRSVAGLNAQSKGERLGIYKPGEEEERPEPRERKENESFSVQILGRLVPVTQTKAGVRATEKGSAIKPESVERYLKQKFGDHLDEVRQAMQELAASFLEKDLERQAFTLYEKFRPDIPEGKRGWGAAGPLNLDQIRALKKT